MKVMTLNCGSSSVKYALVDIPPGTLLCSGIADRIMSNGSFIEHFNSKNQKSIHYHESLTYTLAIELIISFLINQETGGMKNNSELSAIGHRVVHGGEKFKKSVIIDDKVIKEIEDCSVDLIATHPPYVDIIKYSDGKIEGDLSNIHNIVKYL